MADDQVILSILFGIAMVIASISIVRGWIAKARLHGMREVVDTIIRAVSYHYERPSEPLPKEVEKAIDDLHAGVKRRTNDKERCPSSGNLRLIRHFEKGGSGSSGVRV